MVWGTGSLYFQCLDAVGLARHVLNDECISGSMGPSGDHCWSLRQTSFIGRNVNIVVSTGSIHWQWTCYIECHAGHTPAIPSYFPGRSKGSGLTNFVLEIMSQLNKGWNDNNSHLMAIFFKDNPHKPVPECLHSDLDSVWDKDDGGGCDNWSYKTC